MNSAQWTRLKALFHAACALPPAEREPILTGAADDPEVQDELRLLLAADAQAANFTPRPPTAAHETIHTDDRFAEAQLQIGRSARSLPNRGSPGCRWHGHGLSRLRYPPGTPGRGQAGARSLARSPRRGCASFVKRATPQPSTIRTSARSTRSAISMTFRSSRWSTSTASPSMP